MVRCAARPAPPAATSSAPTACRRTCRATIYTASRSPASSAASAPETAEGLTTIRNFYDGNEFIKSTDPYFRPVDQTTAPDGTIYITDMYHGIIQEAQWSGPGTYLRARIQQYDLDKVIHKGRIWRLVYDGVKFDRSDALARDTHGAADERRDGGAARDAPRPSERLVARHGAAAAGAEAGQVGRADTAVPA